MHQESARRSPTFRLLAGFIFILTTVGIYSAYTVSQIRNLRRLQLGTIDRNRADSFLLLRIQGDLNSLALAMRDILDANEPYPLQAWEPQFARIRKDLADAVRHEAEYSPGNRTQQQTRYLEQSLRQFWDAAERIFVLAHQGQPQEARSQIQLSLQARQAALGNAVARLLVQNNISQKNAAEQTQQLYSGVEQNVYIFVSAMLFLIVLTAFYLLHDNRRLFAQLNETSDRRRELARQLISLQENLFRSISRELHDDFGQILTAVGVMLQRLGRRAGSSLIGELTEIQETVQTTLEKVRLLSHALHPVALDEAGIESALDAYLPRFERQTGIQTRYEKTGCAKELDRDKSIHLYRVMQEALNNVSRHSRSLSAVVRVHYSDQSVVLEVEDRGVGFQRNGKSGIGLISMRERAELVGGRIEFCCSEAGGALVRMTVPLDGTNVEA
jgi:signal transduction histidine kinase